MTIAPQSATLGARDMPSAIAALRANGLRLSTARRLVLETLFAADGPATAEQLAAGIDGRLPQSDVASLYRNLETLEQLGLVRHLHVGHGAGRYVLSGDADPGYVSCDGCGALERLDGSSVESLRRLIGEQTGYRVRFTHFPIVGRCADCAARADADAGELEPRHVHA